MATQNEPVESADLTTSDSATSELSSRDSTADESPTNAAAPQEAATDNGAANDAVSPKIASQTTASDDSIPSAGMDVDAADDESATITLEMADLAEAVESIPMNNGDTQPVSMLAASSQMPNTTGHQGAPTRSVSNASPATAVEADALAEPATSPFAAPIASPEASDIAADASTTAEPDASDGASLDATPKAATRRPTPFIAQDDPNVTNQLVSSGGLTGLDVLGSLNASSGSRANAAETPEPLPGGVTDEVDPAWAMADQPTLAFPPQTRLPGRPAYLETGEQEVWPPRPTPAPTVPRSALVDQSEHETPPPFEPVANPHPIPRPTTRPVLPNERLASPTGRRPLGNADAAYSDARRRRYVELQMQRGAHERGQPGPADNLPITQMVRQWWKDLMPGMQKALDHQHEARASGVYPLPAHEGEPAVGTRMGDVFGRLAAAVRDLGERAQSAAMPTINRIHDRAEHAAQAIVGKLEGPQLRQQAPFLGPGRVAVFFRQGVTVGQAQRLLLVHRAQPMRLIPRKHGFLARVIPGREAEVGAELRQHPYVRDVVYLEYDNPLAGHPAAAH